VKTNPILFLQQVRQEAAKVTWPSRSETVVTTVMVLIMVVLASFFFLGVDAVLKWLVEKVLFALT
jgi:preprotein translocase subunit SecE